MENYRKTYMEWCSSNIIDEASRKELLSLNDLEIKERFYRELDFGTAGLRGIIALGPNCMNIYTVRKATQGLCEDILLSEDCSSCQRGVVISYDSRRFSHEFALESAMVLAANGIKAYLFDELRPVPELSFAVSFLGCVRGIMITASHNPKEYNGYKVYGPDGGQLPPESADSVVSIISKLDTFRDVKVMGFNEAKEKGLIEIIGHEVDEAYYKSVLQQSVNSDAIKKVGDDFRVIYSPLHGSGNKPVREILRRLGCENVRVVKKQELPDPEFSTVNSPNPENMEGFTLAIEMAREEKADIIFATDPDADRLGVVVKNDDGEYFPLTGNQIGVLLTEFILRSRKESGTLPSNGAVIKTIVSTDMVKPIAKDYNIRVYDVLTGFKFIGEKIFEFENNILDGKYVFGFEESYGSLAGTYCRDKDAVCAAMLVTEMAADYKLKGMTLYDGLIHLYKKYGYYADLVKNYTFGGIDGAEKMRSIMEELRNNPPREIAGMTVTKLWDVQRGTKLDFSDGSEEGINLPKSNVLKYEFGDEGWIAVRPSGTEPKIKFYFSVKGMEKQDVEARLCALVQEMEKNVI